MGGLYDSGKLFDAEAEYGIVGAVMLSDAHLRPLQTIVGLRPEHFGIEVPRKAYRAMLDLALQGKAITPVTVGAITDLEPNHVDRMAAYAPAVSAVLDYARHVMDLAHWRTRRTAGLLLVEAADGQDMAKVAQAEALLTPQSDDSERTLTPEMLADQALERLTSGEEETFTLPFAELVTACAGGLRRGEVMLLGGWSSFGKSALLDQTLEGIAAEGAKVHLYINEMSTAARVDRMLARHSGVALSLIRRRRLTSGQLHLASQAANKIPFGITDCAGWTAEDIMRHARWHHWDVVGIDILHLIEHREERDLAAISRTINQMCKESTCNCGVIATIHLNENRVSGQTRPAPTLGDIRGSGMLKNDADIVTFVHREQGSDGTPEESGKVYIAKNRNGELGGVEVVLIPTRVTFQRAA
jgi:replicative DNA helicase